MTEKTLCEAETLVINAENKFLTCLMRTFYSITGDPNRRQKLLKQIVSEKDRLDPSHHCADEEEVIIYNMEHKI